MVYTQTWEPCYFITCETTKKKLVVIIECLWVLVAIRFCMLKSKKSANSILCLNCYVDVKLASLLNWLESMCIQEGLFIYMYVWCNISYNWSVSSTDCSRWLHLVCSRRFIPESVFYTKSVLLSLHFMPQAMFYTQSVAHIPGFMLAGTLQYNPTIL